jgi:hypothetical protein
MEIGILERKCMNGLIKTDRKNIFLFIINLVMPHL